MYCSQPLGRRIQTMQRKKKKLRHNEYYDMQRVFDELYASSKNGNNFYKLYEIIISKQNILLAYRNLKTNSGSETAGVDGKTIADIKKRTEEEVIRKVRNKLNNYQPQAVKRVYIPKAGSDKTRPLGIPTIWDRLVQQCILQVLEPVCEPKFYKHSYGFRQNRACEHAISRIVSLVNVANHYYCVDVDVKGFFDNVDHGKLLKQIWTLGIRDKRIISIISKILKSEIAGEGIPTKGTPQGGIISPLLSLIVLNELDWWVSSQWETFKTSGNARGGKGWFGYAHKYTNLKDGFIIRYADDFKIMCKSYQEAQRYYYATVNFLNKRLKLEISPEKSKVVNLRKNSSDFLGFKIKAIPKGKTKYGYVVKTDMNKKAIAKAKEHMKKRLLDIVRKDTMTSIGLYNSTVMGLQNYYRVATNIYNNLMEVSYSLLPSMRIRLRTIAKTKRFCEMDKEFRELTHGIRPNTKIYVVKDRGLLPISGVRRYNPLNFSQEICDYTIKGRKKIHDNITTVQQEGLTKLLDLRNPKETIEFNDNLISAYIMQRGKCFITKEPLNLLHGIAIRRNPNEKNKDYHTNIVIIHQFFYNLLFLNENDFYRKLKIMTMTLNSQNLITEIFENYKN